MSGWRSVSRGVSASLIKLGRHTVERHLRTVEAPIDRQIAGCLTELDLALRLQELAGAEELFDTPPSSSGDVDAVLDYPEPK